MSDDFFKSNVELFCDFFKFYLFLVLCTVVLSFWYEFRFNSGLEALMIDYDEGSSDNLILLSVDVKALR